MAEINDAEAIAFVNNYVRPLCEKVRDLKVLLDDTTATWFLGVNPNFANGSDTVEDGREAEGVSRLTAADVTNAITQFQALQTVLDGGGVMNVIRKPTVRQIEIS